MIDEIHIQVRVNTLRVKASSKYGISPDKCHLGHLVLQAMLDRPRDVHQIDGATNISETNASVVKRSVLLADAMRKSGLQVGDHVVIMGNNHLDLCIPYFASHYNGHTLCAIDPTITLDDLISLLQYISPKIVFCPKDKLNHVKQALEKNAHQEVRIVVFDDETCNLQKFTENHNASTNNFQPAIFDQTKTTCWLMLTSGTTGLPKVAIIPYSTLMNALSAWWSQFTEKWHMTMAMATIQWMSSLMFFISTPLMGNVRLQSSVPVTPQLLVMLINKYKPNVTAWTPYLLGQFIEAAGNYVDLSCFKYIAIGGSAIEKPLYETFSAKCSAYLYLVYGMTELLAPVFDFNKNTPFGSVGKPYPWFQYKLVGENGEDDKSQSAGELWIKGNAFFKGYLNNPEETDKLLTPDGWLKTGDIFYRDEQNYYYFVERKRLLIKVNGNWVSPLQLEGVVSKHPGVAEVCVVGIPDPKSMETPVAAIIRRNGSTVQPQEIFDLVRDELPEIKQIYGGIFFAEKMPVTPSGKIHRAKVKEMALRAQKVVPQTNEE